MLGTISNIMLESFSGFFYTLKYTSCNSIPFYMLYWQKDCCMVSSHHKVFFPHGAIHWMPFLCTVTFAQSKSQEMYLCTWKSHHINYVPKITSTGKYYYRYGEKFSECHTTQSIGRVYRKKRIKNYKNFLLLSIQTRKNRGGKFKISIWIFIFFPALDYLI